MKKKELILEEFTAEMARLACKPMRDKRILEEKIDSIARIKKACEYGDISVVIESSEMFFDETIYYLRNLGYEVEIRLSGEHHDYVMLINW